MTLKTSDTRMSCIGCRHVIAVLGFISFAMIDSQRISLAITMVKMVNSTALTLHQERSEGFVSCPAPLDDNEHSSQKNSGEFNWSPEEESLVLGVGFFCYALPPLIIGRFAEKFGAKWMIFGGNLIAGLSFLFSPLASRCHVYAMVAVQGIRGICQGLIMSANFVLITKWTPQTERGFLPSFLISGFYAGTLISGMVSGYICDTFGWPSVFYLFGAIGILHSISSAFLIYESPKDHPRISNAELKYITENQEFDLAEKRDIIPWGKILRCPAVYATQIGIIGRYWVVVYFLSLHPLYLGKVLHIPIVKNGLINSLPVVLQIIGIWSASKTSDWLLKKGYMKVNTLRKTFDFAGCLGFSICMIGVYFAKCHHLTNIICFSISLFFVGTTTPGAKIAPIDMSPKFAGTLQGIFLSIAMMASFLLPIIVAPITKHQTLDEWHTVFIIVIAVEMGSTIIFAIWGSAKVQPWNFSEEVHPSEKNTEKT